MDKHSRYNNSEKGRERSYRYDQSYRGRVRKLRWEVANRVPNTRFPECSVQRDALNELEAYLASGSSLPLYAWLNEVDPLPKLMRITPETAQEPF
jgi:hypothetical protein